MRCLHCGKRLSLLRKFSDAEFCSDEHRQEFQQQQSDLALARLIEAQNRMQRPKPAKPLGEVKPPKRQKQAVVEEEPVIPMARGLGEIIHPAAARTLQLPALQLQLAPEPCGLPAVEHALNPKGFPAPGQLALAAPLPPAPPPVRGALGRAVFRLHAALPARTASTPVPELRTIAALLPIPDPQAVRAGAWPVPAAAPVQADDQRAALPEARFLLDPIEAPPAAAARVEKLPAFGLAVRIPLALPAPPPVRVVSRHGWLNGAWTPAAPGLPASAIQRRTPGLKPSDGAGKLLAGQALALAGQAKTAPEVQPCWAEAGRLPAWPDWPVPEVKLRSAGPAGWEGARAVQGVKQFAQQGCAAMPAAPRPHLPSRPAPAPPPPEPRRCQRTARLKVKAMAAAAGVSAQAVEPEISFPQPVLPGLRFAAPQPGLRSEGQQPLTLDIQAGAAACCPTLPWLSGLLDAAREAAYPQPTFHTQAPDPPAPPAPPANEAEPAEQAPPLQRVLPLQLPRPAGCGRGEPLWAGPVMAVATPPDPRMPASRLKLDHADGSGPRQQRACESPKRPKRSFAFDPRKLPGRRFWMHAPADLKWVALGLPLLLVLVLYSFRPAAPVREAAGEELAATGKTAIGGQLNTLQRVILNRAAVKLFDDFRGGLGAWSGEDGWSKSWKYGEASFLEPGQLALYTPSVGMRDYTFQFLGQIERKSLNWVFRAADTKNYYAMRIVMTRGGPLAEAQLVRSTVIGGKERDVKSLPIPFPVQPDTLYLVRMDIRGQDYTTYIQGQVVDTFSDANLEQGGVGFYGGKGDKSMLRWVEVTHQYDFLGRLCALVSPYDMAAQGKQTN